MSRAHLPRRRPSPIRCDVAAVAITLLAFGLFLWRADAKGIWWDEGLSLYRALREPAYILSNRIDFPGAPTVDQHPPLYFLALHAMVRGAGESDLALRFPSVLCATLLVPLVYALGVRLRGRATGRVAALLAALSPFHLWYAQEARPYAMVAALSAASVLLLWRAAADRDRGAAAASGVLAALALATQYFAALVLLFQALWGVLFWWAERRARGLGRPARLPVRWWSLPAMALPAVVLVVAVISVRPLLPMLATQRSYVPLDIILLDALNSFSLGLSVNLREVWGFDVAFGLALLLGVASLAQQPPSLGGALEGRSGLRRVLGLTLLLGYLLIPALGIWAVSLWVPVYMNSRYVIVSSPAFYLGVALGIDLLWRWRRVAGVAALVVLLVGMGISIDRYHRHERYATRQDYRGAAAYVAANERVGDLVVVTGHENLGPFQHYYRGNLEVVATPARAHDLDDLGTELVALGEDHGRLWLVECPAYVSDPEGRAARWLDEHMRREDRRAFPGYYGAPVTVHGFLPEDPVRLEGSGAADALGAFGNRLALEGYTLRYFDAAGQPHEVAASEGSVVHVDGVPAGNVLSAALRVRPLTDLPELKASLRLVNADGIPWAQRDRELLRVLPTRDWPVGAEVRFDADLWVPPGTPPGTYDLQLVLYEAESVVPLNYEVTGNEGGPLRLGAITVGRPARRFDRHAFLGVVSPLRPSVQYGRALGLEAYDLAPRSLGSDDVVTLHLFWRLLDADIRRYELTLNWTDASGRVAHTASHAVADVAASADLRWGDVLHGILRVTPPDDLPPGDYRLHLLVRDASRGGYLWLRRGGLPWPSRNLGLGVVTIRGAG